MANEFKIPQRLDLLSVKEVGQCLKLLNMEKYVEVFRQECVDGSLLVSLSEDALVALGVSNKLHRTKLLKFIAGWRPSS